jgi:N-acetylglutamate synthase-like GNAT family acetyltransferase
MAAISDSGYSVRIATKSDIKQIDSLIVDSCVNILPTFYTEGQIEASLGVIFGVDIQLIRDHTLFVATAASGEVVACGGWSFRVTRCGGKIGLSDEDISEAMLSEDSPKLDPSKDAARIRAFFVHSQHVRKRLSRRIIEACEMAIKEYGFSKIDVAATLCGQLLYEAMGYSLVREEQMPLANEQPPLHVIHLSKTLI